MAKLKANDLEAQLAAAKRKLRAIKRGKDMAEIMAEIEESNLPQKHRRIIATALKLWAKS